MTILATVIVTLIVIGGILAALIYASRHEIRRQQNQYEAQLRDLEIRRLEFDTEQRLRGATRDAMDKMLAEVRKHASPDQ